jgi:glycosyltransferase involved in cell wall biosynthesis
VRRLIWASLDDYLPPGTGHAHVGRNVANHRFFQSILKYGHFDEYHFFLANSAHRRLFENQHGGFIEEVGAVTKVRLFDRFELLDQVRKCDYTVFHQSDHITLFNSLCHFRNRAGTFPVTAFIHSLSYQEFMGTYLQMVLGGATAMDSLICSSTPGKRALEGCFQQIAKPLDREGPAVQLEVIPLGVDGDHFPPIDRPEARKQLGLDGDDLIGLCFGRFSDYDKMDLFPLVQAFRNISNGHLPWRLVLAGAVHSEDYLKVLKLWIEALRIGDRVTVLTDVPDNTKALLYRAADFFVSLSDNPQETFGLTLLEAMASELPLLVSDFDGYREIVTDDIGHRIETTWDHFSPLVALGPLMDGVTYHRHLAQSVCVDMDQLADRLAFFFSSPERCRHMGQEARRRFLRLYDHRVVIERLEWFWLALKDGFNLTPEESYVNPLAMDVFGCFSHYATHTLAPDSRVELSENGRNFLDSGADYPLLAEMRILIKAREVKAIMNQTRRPRSVGETLGSSNGEGWRTRYAILWMLKHGLLRFAGGNGR